MADDTKTKAREARLAQALRTNLRRRKAAPQPASDGPAPDGPNAAPPRGPAVPDGG